MKTQQEPIHDTPEAAIRWVLANTHDFVFSGGDPEVYIRPCADTGAVLRLRKDSNGTWYWSRMHRHG